MLHQVTGPSLQAQMKHHLQLRVPETLLALLIMRMQALLIHSLQSSTAYAHQIVPLTELSRVVCFRVANHIPDSFQKGRVLFWIQVWLPDALIECTGDIPKGQGE